MNSLKSIGQFKNLKPEFISKLSPCAFQPDIDYNYLVNNSNDISRNLKIRKSQINLDKLLDSLKLYLHNKDSTILEGIKSVLMGFPNLSHPNVFAINTDSKGTVTEYINSEIKSQGFLTFEQLATSNLLAKYQLIALLEKAVIAYVLNMLAKNERCGFSLNNIRDQIYNIKGTNLCLAGTSEIPLASLYSGIDVKCSLLPLKLCALSRCYRAELTHNRNEHGLYRVNYFDKIEMFGITTSDCTNKESEKMLFHFINIQKEIFNNLGLYCKVIEMAGHELGLPAYHKFDIEAWMPGRRIFGELSSASNCTDFQSRRLGIRYLNDIHENNEETSYQYAHTVNGTACAIPRLLISLLETHQNADSTINIPDVLLPYYEYYLENENQTSITKHTLSPDFLFYQLPIRNSKVK